jgi:hypothetical protein
MNKLFYILLFFIIFGCKATSNHQENVFIKTKIYVGNYDSSYVINDKFTYITTTMGLFKIKGNPIIKDNSKCYINIEYPTTEMHPEILEQMKTLYFSWNGSEKKYKVYNKIPNL